MLCLGLSVPGGWTLSFLSLRREPRVDQLSPLLRNLPSLPQAGNPAKCRHGHCPTAATEANDPGPSCLQCCDHPWARPHFHVPFVACRPRPHSHPGLAFSGTFWSPLPAPSHTLSAPTAALLPLSGHEMWPLHTPILFSLLLLSSCHCSGAVQKRTGAGQPAHRVA